ncbi:MAG: hypothetical protein JWO38_8124, partial [Gemmataceae bacterium]|nr:hypothetical protein [Gemmataceae bacterium]
MSCHRYTRKPAFTLIELLVVWYSPRKVDTKLTVGLVVRPFKFVRGDIPQGGMTADAVVEHFQ